MNVKLAALQLGLRLVQYKLGQAVGDPSFSVFAEDGQPEAQRNPDEKLQTSETQIRDRSAKIQPPRVVTTR